MAPTYTLSLLAHTKLLAHALKHPHARVNGVLLGTPGAPLAIADAVPLQHHWTTLSPMLEIGLDIARVSAAGRELQVVGYYQATEYIDADAAALGAAGEQVAQRIRARCADALAVVIDGAKLGADGADALIPYVATPAGFRPAPRGALQPADAARALAAGRAPALLDALGDFDDHLEDLSVDWLRNAAVDRALEAR